MNKILLPVFAAAAIGAGAFGAYQLNQNAAQSAQLSDLQRRLEQAELDRLAALAQLDKLRAESDAMKENIARLSKERDAAKAKSKELAENGAPNPGGEAAGNQNKRAGMDFANLIAKRMDDPEVRKGIKSGLDRAVEALYLPMFKKLGLDDATSKLASDLVSERNLQAFDKGRRIMMSGGGEEAMAKARQEVEAVKADYDGKLKSVLGDKGFSQFTTHEQTVGEQRAVDSFSRSFERSGAPLQTQQKDALLEVMRSERLKNPVNEIPDLGGGPGMAMLLTEDELKARDAQEKQYEQGVLNRAPQAGLSPDQVITLEESFKRRNEQRAMSRVMGRMFMGGGR